MDFWRWNRAMSRDLDWSIKKSLWNLHLHSAISYSFIALWYKIYKIHTVMLISKLTSILCTMKILNSFRLVVALIMIFSLKTFCFSLTESCQVWCYIRFSGTSFERPDQILIRTMNDTLKYQIILLLSYLIKIPK